MEVHLGWPEKLLLVLCLCLTIITFTCVVYIYCNYQEFDDGCIAVKLMYQFTSPTQIISNQQALKEVITEDEWNRLNIDAPDRVVSAYYKFHYTTSYVDIVDHREGYVLYTLDNDFIEPTDMWVMLYERDAETGLLCNIREYKMVDTMKGGYKD